MTETRSGPGARAVDHDIIKLLLILAAAPFWVPVVRSVVKDVWAQSELDPPKDESHDRRRGDPKRPVVWSDAGPNWSQRRRVNTEWDTGRRAPSKGAAGFDAERRTFGRKRAG